MIDSDLSPGLVYLLSRGFFHILSQALKGFIIENIEGSKNVHIPIQGEREGIVLIYNNFPAVKVMDGNALKVMHIFIEGRLQNSVTY